MSEILTNTTSAVKFVAPWRESDPVAPRFFLRAGSVLERAAMEAELSGEHRAGRVHGFELRAAIKSGVEALLADDLELDRVIELLDLEAEGNAVDMSEVDNRLLAEVRKTLAQHWPEYRDLVAQLERRREIAPIVALRRFCVDIVGEGISFARGRDGLVTEASLTSIEPFEIALAGNRAYGLQYATEAERFLALASSSDESPENSTPDTSPAAGSSVKKGGRKTPASPSRRGSGQS